MPYKHKQSKSLTLEIDRRHLTLVPSLADRLALGWLLNISEHQFTHIWKRDFKLFFSWTVLWLSSQSSLSWFVYSLTGQGIFYPQYLACPLHLQYLWHDYMAINKVLNKWQLRLLGRHFTFFIGWSRIEIRPF